jgi:hypothetical protein
MIILRFIVLLLIIPVPSSLAEYRAYELVIKNSETGNQRTVVSTLDNIQYASYHPINRNEEVSLMRSWKCWGNSDYFQDICPAPEMKPQERFPASQN